MNKRAFEKAYISAYNEVANKDVDSVEAIPDRALNFISRVPIRQLLVPVVQDELSKGRSRQEVAISLDIPVGLVRWIGVRCGHFKAS